MFVGHSFLAFAILGGGLLAVGVDRQRALTIAVFGALFALTPDADVILALGGLASEAPIAGFWTATAGTHRAVTHSLVLAVPVTLAVVLWTAGRRWIAASIGIALVGLGIGDWLTATLLAAFVGGALAVAVAASHFDVDARATGLAAGVGLVTHPFGDLFTGTPPAMFWPIAPGPFASRIAPFSDPTTDFFLAFGVELLAIWIGTMVALALLPALQFRTPKPYIRPRALLGVVYAGTVLILPRPTVDFAYPFVFSVLPVGTIGLRRPLAYRDADWWVSAWITGLAAVTLAALGWGVADLLV